MSPKGPRWLMSGAYCLGPALRRLGIQTWRGLPSHPSGPACQRRLLLCFVLQLQLSLQFPWQYAWPAWPSPLAPLALHGFTMSVSQGTPSRAYPGWLKTCVYRCWPCCASTLQISWFPSKKIVVSFSYVQRGTSLLVFLGRNTGSGLPLKTKRRSQINGYALITHEA
jgi:hypothetical protein